MDKEKIEYFFSEQFNVVAETPSEKAFETAQNAIKTYKSGRLKQDGDIVLFGLLETKIGKEISLELITLHQDEIDNYELTKNNGAFPILKYKNK